VDAAAASQSFKNKEVPMQPFTGPLGGPSLAQQNISKSSRKKIKVLQPLESAAHGEDFSVMGEGNKIHKKKILTRHLIHTPKGNQAKMSAKKKRRNRHLNHLKTKEQGMHQNNDDGGNADVRHVTSHPNVVKQENNEDEEDEESPDVAESGSGSGTQLETDNADIFPEKEEFWSR